MRILIPMAGAGSRFTEAGYAVSKPLIPTTDRRTGEVLPMVVAAVRDLPLGGRPSDGPLDIVFVIRDSHAEADLPERIREFYPAARFVEVDHLTEGQASTCLLAKAMIDDGQPLLIAACDNGMDFDPARFATTIAEADAVIFTFRNNQAVLASPKSYGWIRVAGDGDDVIGLSIKVPVSDAPMRDHAVVGAFWFREGRIFVSAAERMIAENERINGEFYVDQVFRTMIDHGLRVKVLEVDRYLCFGTPTDYEDYEATLRYWRAFVEEERL